MVYLIHLQLVCARRRGQEAVFLCLYHVVFLPRAVTLQLSYVRKRGEEAVFLCLNHVVFPTHAVTGGRVTT